MSKLFNMDNPVWVFMGKLADMLLLSGLWLVCSLPVITMGASTAALYHVSLKLAENQEGYIVKSFFKAFKENLKQGMALGTAAAFIGVFLASDLYVYYHIKGQAGTLLFTMFFVLTAVYLMTVTYLFPLMARCGADWKKLLLMSFVMAVKNFGWTLLMIVTTVCIAAAGFFVMAPLLLIGIGLTAYIHSKILNFVFRQYHFNLA